MPNNSSPSTGLTATLTLPARPARAASARHTVRVGAAVWRTSSLFLDGGPASAGDVHESRPGSPSNKPDNPARFDVFATNETKGRSPMPGLRGGKNRDRQGETSATAQLRTSAASSGRRADRGSVEGGRGNVRVSGQPAAAARYVVDHPGRLRRRHTCETGRGGHRDGQPAPEQTPPWPG